MLGPLVPPLVAFTQEHVEVSPQLGWESLVAAYGAAAPFAAILVYAAYLLRKDLKANEEKHAKEIADKDAEIKELSTSAMEKVLPLVLDATHILGDAVAVLNTVKQQNFDMTRTNVLMNDLQDSIEDLRRILTTEATQRGSLPTQRPKRA